ncbi:unnamed protein product [Pleuronectes platessa]|uniref:Uncharacterized protein n=1 Tax=Pleuronectes platessa TaxID=8262 RepID=A0A9N7VF34_PLEPL|nr:unnamed protein product [Pleuronectes platessa]
MKEETEDEPEEEIEEELQEETADELEEEIEEELEVETADEFEEEINDALEAAISQQQEYRAKLNKLTSENNHVASENKRLQGDLEDAVQQHQKDREACSRLEEQVKK